MTDKEEQISKTANVPEIRVTEGAAGGEESEDCKKKGIIGSITDKVKNIGQSKRSKSKSPETRKVGDSSKEGVKSARPSSSPSKKDIKDKFKRFFKPSGGNDDEERENLCEEEAAEQAKTRLAPPEKDMGIASPSSATEPVEEKWKPHERSSSVSSAPSGYSSLPDDDADMTSLDSPEDGKQK
ncbi:unnamed protein product [Larinioides sclopetarius]|uniref:Uncharacterized protein n=1 Tax=Larinioides sclopetarius TaxID=280406 RepID=A0AAV1Z3T4_9ARAC